MTAINGHDAQTAENQAAEAVFANYNAFTTQLGAICTLLANVPLQPMLAACKRHQTRSMLTLPAGVSVEQATQQHQGLRNDQRILEAAINLQRVLAAVAGGN